MWGARLYVPVAVGATPSQYSTRVIWTVYPVGIASPFSEYIAGPLQVVRYGLCWMSLTHSAAERTTASVVAWVRCEADTRIVVIRPVRIATNVTPTSTMVTSSSGIEKPASPRRWGGRRIARSSADRHARRHFDVLRHDRFRGEG